MRVLNVLRLLEPSAPPPPCTPAVATKTTHSAHGDAAPRHFAVHHHLRLAGWHSAYFVSSGYTGT